MADRDLFAELTDSVPWKWWAKHQKFDKLNFQRQESGYTKKDHGDNLKIGL